MNIYPILLTQNGSVLFDSVSVMMTFFVIIAFIITWILNRLSILRIRKQSAGIKDASAIMRHTLNMSQSYIIQLNISAQHAVNMHGDFLTPKGMGYQESRQHMHPDDWTGYQRFIKQMMDGAETAECFFRWNVGTKEAPVWRNIRNLGIAEYANKYTRVPTSIYCTLTDETDNLMLEQEEHQLTDKYLMTFEQSIIGLAFYDKDGNLLTTNQKMRDILNFQSPDDPYYYGNTIYDMPTFKEVLNNRHIEELWFCTKSVILERGVNCYTEMRVHPIYDAEGELVYITFSIRDVTTERDLYMKNKSNDEFIRQQTEAIQEYEKELQYLMESCDMRYWRASFLTGEVNFYKGLSLVEKTLSLSQVPNMFVDKTIAKKLLNPQQNYHESSTYLIQTKPFFHDNGELQWNMLDAIAEKDEAGNVIGFYGIIRNVNDLIKKQEQLMQETERAKESGHMKSVFMANMTHEIRTPLNSIVGFSDVLPMLQTPEEKQEIIKVIMNNCDMLLRLINDILALSTADSSGITIEEETVDFVKTFANICQSMEQRVQNPNVQFIADSPRDALVISVDPGRIQQVITNFVTNAVKYTQEGHIKVGYDYRDNGLYIYCEDTGTGIPKEAQKRVFERFVKLNDYIQGTGLGLSICKAIADKCHGKIGVDSEGEGKGSTFWMWIPCEEQKKQEGDI